MHTQMISEILSKPVTSEDIEVLLEGYDDETTAIDMNAEFGDREDADDVDTARTEIGPSDYEPTLM